MSPTKEELTEAPGYTPKDMAARFGVALNTVYRWRVEMGIRARKFDLSDPEIAEVVRLLSIAEASERLGVGVSTINNWRRRLGVSRVINAGRPKADPVRRQAEASALEGVPLAALKAGSVTRLANYARIMAAWMLKHRDDPRLRELLRFAEGFTE